MLCVPGKELYRKYLDRSKIPVLTKKWVYPVLNCTHKNGQEEKEESKKQDKSGF